MAALATTDYLKYANLQMAAEAFLVSAGGVPKKDADLMDALKAGNLHASKFTEAQATAFVTKWVAAT